MPSPLFTVGMLIVPHNTIKNNNYSISGLPGSVLRIDSFDRDGNANCTTINNPLRPEYLGHRWGSRELKYFKPLVEYTPKGNCIMEHNL